VLNHTCGRRAVKTELSLLLANGGTLRPDDGRYRGRNMLLLTASIPPLANNKDSCVPTARPPYLRLAHKL